MPSLILWSMEKLVDTLFTSILVYLLEWSPYLAKLKLAQQNKSVYVHELY